MTWHDGNGRLRRGLPRVRDNRGKCGLAPEFIVIDAVMLACWQEKGIDSVLSKVLWERIGGKTSYESRPQYLVGDIGHLFGFVPRVIANDNITVLGPCAVNGRGSKLWER